MSGPTVRAASAVSAPVLALAEDLSHDLWRARGLGETCRRTYLQLAQRLRDGAGSGLPVAEVANGTDVGERQARRNLGRLAAAGLARREPDGRWSAEQRDGEELAEDLGVAEQRQRHGAERLGWRLQRTLRRAGDLQASGADARDRCPDRPDRGESVVARFEGGAVSASGPNPAKRGQSDIEDGERLDEATAASWTEAFPEAASPLPVVGRRALGDGEGAEGATLAAVARHRGPHAGAPELPVAPELAEIAWQRTKEGRHSAIACPDEGMAAMTAGDRRRATDEVLVAALARGATQAQAGAIAGVSERTVRRRLERPGFAERVRNERTALVARTSARLTALTVRAVDALADLLSAGGADGVRLRTALGVLDAARVWREAGEVEERLSAVEQALADDSQRRPA